MEQKERFERGKIAGSAAILKDRKILLLQRGESQEFFPLCWTFPSGGIEETDWCVEDTVQREVKEETNLDFEIREKFGFYESKTAGKRHFALVYVGTGSGEVLLQESEVSAYAFCSYKEAIVLPLAFAYREVIEDLHKKGCIV
jgi:ADP-ribose pyrophosphatase YjhB (NUDIX family)